MVSAEYAPAESYFAKFHFLHHLSERAVGQDHDRIAVRVSEVERVIDEIRHFLHPCGGKDDQTIVAVPAPLVAWK